MKTDYKTFLANKHREVEPSGFTIDPDLLNPMMFPWQRQITSWNCKQGRSADFMECGTGKTAIQLVWAEQIILNNHVKRVLILCPLAVAAQTKREAEKFNIQVQAKVVREGFEVDSGISICNYDRLDKMPIELFGAVVWDECFAKGTKIDLETSSNRIENIRPGDKIRNASGIDTVVAIAKRKVSHAVAIVLRGKKVIVSPNHLWFTKRGWKRSEEIKSEDSILDTRSAMRVLRKAIQANVCPRGPSEILFSELFTELANEHHGIYGQDENTRGCGKKTGCEKEVAQNEKGKRECRETEAIQSWERPQTGEGMGWQNDGTSKDCSVATQREVVSRVDGQDGSETREIQVGYCKQEIDDLYRSRWEFSSVEERERCEAGFDFEFIGVDGVEIYKPGHPELGKLKDADGSLYFYDIEAERHPTFSVNGCIVHNSGILKSYTGQTKRKLLKLFSGYRYKLACTATPAPNDLLELGNHAEGLNVMPSNEMIARFFVNDSMQAGSYRLKRHGERDFWRWVTSWAMSLSKPSDIGGDDAGFDLPPLNINRVVIDAMVDAPAGMLFEKGGVSAMDIHREKRLTAELRASEIAKLCNGKSEQWLVWCDTNYEADALAKAIPDAIDVRGSDSITKKESSIDSFLIGESRVLICKPRIAGYGLNLQHCHKVAYIGLSYSFEQFYQSVRRCWRFSQTDPVDVFVIETDGEAAISRVVFNKERAHVQMKSGMIDAVKEDQLRRLQGRRKLEGYDPKIEMEIPSWLKTKT